MYNQENLSKFKTMNDLAPEVMKAFLAFDKLAVAVTHAAQALTD